MNFHEEWIKVLKILPRKVRLYMKISIEIKGEMVLLLVATMDLATAILSFF